MDTLERPLCIVCGTGKAILRRDGKGWRDRCDRCRRNPESNKARRDREKTKRSPYRVFKKDSCEKCGFVPEHSCQLDVDHIDGNRKNNEPSNLMTLCANCHRLKTFTNNDWNRYAKVRY